MNTKHAPGRDTWHSVVASNVRAEAARRGVSQRALAEALGVSHTWVNARWFGARPWALDDLERLAQAWGLPPEALVALDAGLPCPHQGGRARV